MTVRHPGLLDPPTPELAAYLRETVAAEKFQAMAMLGIANSRMKDFFDLWVLARPFGFGGPVLAASPLALTAEFGTDRAEVTQWRAFLKKGRLDVGGTELVNVYEFLVGFLIPPAQSVAGASVFTRACRRAVRGRPNAKRPGTAGEEMPWARTG